MGGCGDSRREAAASTDLASSRVSEVASTPGGGRAGKDGRRGQMLPLSLSVRLSLSADRESEPEAGAGAQQLRGIAREHREDLGERLIVIKWEEARTKRVVRSWLRRGAHLVSSEVVDKGARWRRRVRRQGAGSGRQAAGTWERRKAGDWRLWAIVDENDFAGCAGSRNCKPTSSCPLLPWHGQRRLW